MKHIKKMKHIKGINELYASSSGLSNNHNIGFSEEEKKFIFYLYGYRFKDTITTTEEKPSKFLGITYKKTSVDNKVDIYYNDFSVVGKDEDGILIDSGVGGTYRPEGYFWGSDETSNQIKQRLEKIVDSFNNSHNKRLKVSKKDGYYLVSGF